MIIFVVVGRPEDLDDELSLLVGADVSKLKLALWNGICHLQDTCACEGRGHGFRDSRGICGRISADDGREGGCQRGCYTSCCSAAAGTSGRGGHDRVGSVDADTLRERVIYLGSKCVVGAVGRPTLNTLRSAQIGVQSQTAGP